MKILLITQDPPLLSEAAASGDAIRTRQIHRALLSAGHEVVQIWPATNRQRVKGAFRNRDELQGNVIKQAPGAIIVCYWELLGLLPYRLEQPVILDYPAPVTLEEIYESPATVRRSMRRLRLNLQHCDAVMVGNEKQRQLLLNTIIEAGFDLRDSNPVLIVPPGAAVAGPPDSETVKIDSPPDVRSESSFQPMLEWLESASKAPRVPEISASANGEPVLAVPPPGQRLKRLYKLVRQALIDQLFGRETGSGLLLVTRGDLFPSDHGAAVRTVETARALSQRGVRVGIVTGERKFWYRFTDGRAEPEKFPLWVRILSLPAPLVKLLHYSKEIPYNNSFLYLPLTDRSFGWRIIAAAKRLQAGILQAEFPAYALPCIKLRETMDCSVVLVEHNVEYDRIKAQVDELTEAQYGNLKSIEIKLCNDSDAVVCVSDNDRRKLELDGVRPELMRTIPHGVDLAQYDKLPAEDARAYFGIPEHEPLLVFHGTFSYPPNREALHLFAEILLPGLELQGLNAHLLAVGKNPPANRPHPRIHLTGGVEHVAPWLKSADLAVIPLTDGGGTRMKIIDCFAAGLPVISTSKGIEGIPVVQGQHALVIDRWESMIEAIREYWETPAKAQFLARQGREFADSLDWKVVAEKYASLYATLCKNGR